MPYLNVDLDYFSHPKTRRLIGLLEPGADIFPLRLWAYLGKYHPKDGKLIGYTEKEVESIIGWKGEDGHLMQAMATVGFIQKIKNGYQVHDWKDHQGHIVAFKERARQAASKRWNNSKEIETKRKISNATSITASNALTVPYHTIPNHTDTEQREALQLLSEIPGYPFHLETDLMFLTEKEKDYPDIDIVSLLKAWKVYLTDKPLTKQSKPRAQLHNQFGLARKWGRHLKAEEEQRPIGHDVLSKIKQAEMVLEDGASIPE